ncbi:MAG: GNAT family N-acetyltransferase [Reinekea sp.]
MKFSIIKDDLTGPEVALLLNDHLSNMADHSPEESRHALDLSGLQQQDVHFYSVWADTELAGCGAIQLLDAHHAEVKSMKTASAFLRQGVARLLLNHLIETAQRVGVKRLSLETGTIDYFKPAHVLYESAGFKPCPLFGRYREDPYRRYYSLELL